jgi:glutamyl/glutaminyl-tRNA synthetase
MVTATGAAVRMVGKETGVRGPALFHPIRLSLTGLEQGPDLGKVLAALGREETLRRIDLTLGGGGV